MTKKGVRMSFFILTCAYGKEVPKEEEGKREDEEEEEAKRKKERRCNFALHLMQ